MIKLGTRTYTRFALYSRGRKGYLSVCRSGLKYRYVSENPIPVARSEKSARKLLSRLPDSILADIRKSEQHRDELLRGRAIPFISSHELEELTKYLSTACVELSDILNHPIDVVEIAIETTVTSKVI